MRWRNNGNSDRLYFLGLQNYCRWWLQPWKKRHLLFGRKVMTNLDSILKSRDITLLTKVHTSQSYGFSSSHVWMWELDHKEGWPPKSWCFWTVVLEKTLESPLDGKETKQSILKEINAEYSLEGLILNLKLQYFGHLMQKANSLSWCWEGLGAEEADYRGWDGWMASLTWWTWIWVNSGRWWWKGRPGVLWFIGLQRVGHNWAIELNWTEHK